MGSDSAILTPPAEDDRTLARRIAGGDQTAFELLMRRYNRRLYRLARASLRDDSEAKDALQDAYLNAYRAIECAVRQRRSARRRLPQAMRVVFVLRSVEELSVAETAEALGITEEAVRVRHFRAKGMLREALAREIDRAEADLFEFGGVHCDAVVGNVMERLSSLADRG